MPRSAITQTLCYDPFIQVTLHYAIFKVKHFITRRMIKSLETTYISYTSKVIHLDGEHFLPCFTFLGAEKTADVAIL